MSELKHPYYIVSPDYRESSGGIQALHKLCHQINLQGGNAWMVDCNVINPAWKTPRLDAETWRQHKKAQLTPIAVYPEIYSGNPLNADVCVRYMLNHEGLLNGNRLNESEEDLFFWYSSQLIINEPDVDFLTMVGPDLELFYDDGRAKTTTLLYLNRVPVEKVDFTTLPDNIVIISVKNPRPLAELAEILKSASVMYTFEWSGTCNLAALCGTPVVSMVAQGYEKLAISEASIRDMGGAGVCFSDDTAELERERARLWKVRDHMRKFEADFSQQLRHFFIKTQTAAGIKNEEKVVSTQKWLADYPVKNYARGSAETALSVRVIILDDDPAVACHSILSSLRYVGLEAEIYAVDASAEQEQGKSHFSGWLHQLLIEDPCEWVLFLRSGDLIYPELFSSLWLFKEQTAASLAFYSDRVIRQADGLCEMFLPDFDRDYFLALPERFARGAFFRRELCLEIVRARNISPHTVETAFLLQLVSAGLAADIRHVPVPLLQLSSKEREHTSLKESLLAEYLAGSEYSQASVEREGSVFTVRYGASGISKLTVILVVEDDINRTKRAVATFVDTVVDVDYEIIFIDNGSTDPAVREWLSSLATMNNAIFRVFFVDEKINAVSAMNYGISVARGEFTLCLSAGIYFNHTRWLEALLDHCGRAELLACAPFLVDNREDLYSSGRINGGFRRKYGQAETASSTDSSGQADRVAPQQHLLLTTECIMIRTSSCQQAGGLDEQFATLPEAISDLLLRASVPGAIKIAVPLSRVGYDDVLTDVSLVSGNSLFTEKWLRYIAHDPASNPNISREEGEVIRENNRPLLAARLGFPLSALWVFNADDHDEAQRVKELSRLTTASDSLIAALDCQRSTPVELYRLNPAHIVFSDSVASRHAQLIKNKAALPETRFVVELTRESFRNGQCPDEGLQNADTLLVRNSAALTLFRDKHAVLQADKLSTAWQRLAPPEDRPSEHSGKPRVGVVLTDLMTEDWMLIDTLIREMSERVDWIIYGACPDAWKHTVHEYHRKVPHSRLPAMFQSLKLDLALAPLAETLPNQAEGHRVIAQLGACGYPVLASDHEAYKAIVSVKRIKNKTSQWRFMINKLINNPSMMRSLGEALYEEVNACWIHLPGERPAWLKTQSS
ncbi:glycosyltransferase family 2 protein [Pantoea anthophila]|uniref:glycosyltransferase family 2 protein n=1 Tax=Pantoea anthophila TaxID=470931 RepID=UPI00061509A1|nr:glycosyltransferase family A protein [Pantoea anthophila]KKB04222.1 O-antigen biosynthesis protein [Pantoea anthophila]